MLNQPNIDVKALEAISAPTLILAVASQSRLRAGHETNTVDICVARLIGASVSRELDGDVGMRADGRAAQCALSRRSGYA